MVQVAVFNVHARWRVRKASIAALARSVLRGEGCRDARLSVVFIDGRACRSMNRRYLGHDVPTDVISFPIETGSVLEGEVYVNLDKARDQAREWGVSRSNEVARLVIHGTLHLLGYDDQRPLDARRMLSREEHYVAMV